MQCLSRHLWGGVVVGLLGVVMVGCASSPTDWENQNTAGQQAYEQGHYAEAEQYFKAALKEAETFGVYDIRLATSLNNLAMLYRTLGQYAQAESLYQRSLAIWEKTRGPEHPDVAASLNNLALLYQAQGQYAQAEPLYQRSLAIWGKALGPEHPDVATSLENYATLLRQTQRGTEAAKLEARVKAIRAKHAQQNP